MMTYLNSTIITDTSFVRYYVCFIFIFDVKYTASFCLTVAQLVERPPPMREIGVQSSDATDQNRKNRY